MNSYNPYVWGSVTNSYNPYAHPTFAPMSASPIAGDGSNLTPQGWGWLADVAKIAVPIVLSILSTTPGATIPGANVTPMSASPTFPPQAPSQALTPQGWGWLTDVVKAVVPIVLSQLSATPGATLGTMSAAPGYPAASPALIPQSWWSDILKDVVPIILNQLSATPGAGIAPMSAPVSMPGYPSQALTPQGWGWLTDVVKAVVPIVLSQLSATPGAHVAPMSAGPALSPYGGFMFSGPSVSTPFGNFGAGGIGFSW